MPAAIKNLRERKLADTNIDTQTFDMKRLTRTLPLILAAALQLLPLIRNIVTSPAAGSSFAFILRWGIGAGAALGAYDAHSAATNYFTSPTNFTGTVGVPFTNNITI